MRKLKQLFTTVSSSPRLVFFVFLPLLLLTPIVILVNQAEKQLSAAQAETSFVFTAAGDHGMDAKALASMDTVANSGSSFYLALGDLSYLAGGEQNWCNTFKSKFNHVEVLAGNHDTGESVGGNIDNYIQYCPFTLPTLAGSYGKQYYFDYPQTGTPIARFIMIAPGVAGSLANVYNYNVGGNGYTFTENAINEARSQAIPWVIVGMHKNCISTGDKSCEVGMDIMNLLTTKKVDLILQGHDHNYQRSHQLSCLTTNSVNPSCIADSGTDGLYTKGNGPVIIINGEFGRPLYATSLSDTEAGYFAALDSTTFGITKYTVTDTQLSAQYLRSGGGGFADSFTIASNGITPTPTPAQTQTVHEPLADAYVDSANPGVNYGSLNNLYADGWPIALSYLKFDLTSLAGQTITSAKLRIRTTTDPYAGSPNTQYIKLVDNTSWTETGLTYSNRPAVGTQLGSIANTAADTQYEIPLTLAPLQSKIGGLLSLAVDEIEGDGLRFNSRETTIKPQLLLTYATSTTPTPIGSTPTPTPTPNILTTPTPVVPTPTATSTPTPQPTANLLQNPSFESMIAPWTLQKISPANGTVTVVTDTKVDGNASARLVVSTASTNSWYLQFRQAGLSLVAGKTYTVSFWAKASKNLSLQHVVQQTTSPNTLRANRTVTVTPTWQNFTYTFTATASDTGNIFYGFNAAKTTGTIWIDNTSLRSN